MSLTQEALQAYRQQWQAVAQRNDLERQRATITQRWRKLNSLLRMSAALGLYPQQIESESAIPRQRWNRLQQLYLAENQDVRP